MLVTIQTLLTLSYLILPQVICTAVHSKMNKGLMPFFQASNQSLIADKPGRKLRFCR